MLSDLIRNDRFLYVSLSDIIRSMYLYLILFYFISSDPDPDSCPVSGSQSRSPFGYPTGSRSRSWSLSRSGSDPIPIRSDLIQYLNWSATIQSIDIWCSLIWSEPIGLTVRRSIYLSYLILSYFILFYSIRFVSLSGYLFGFRSGSRSRSGSTSDPIWSDLFQSYLNRSVSIHLSDVCCI
jgi:hypothetical protein